MKSIYSLVKWILFVPVFLMSAGLTIFSAAAPEAFSGMFSGDRNTVAKIVTVAILGLLVVSFALSLFDKKTSPAHLLKKNYAAGIFAVISAMAMAASAAFDVTKMLNSDEIRAMSVVTAVLAALGGVAMLYVGLNHFSGTNTPKPIAMLYLALPVWCGAHLIDRFLTHTDSPVAAADTMDLVMFVLLAMFFINAMMIHALIVGKNTVKSAVSFGLPAVVASVVYGFISIFSATAAAGFAFFDLLAGFVYVLLGLYVFSFTAELSFACKTVDDQIVVDEDDESEGFSEEYYNEDEVSEDDADNDEFDEDTAYSEEPVTDFNDDNINSISSEEDSFDEQIYDNSVVSDDVVADELFRAAQQKDVVSVEVDEAVTDNTVDEPKNISADTETKDKSETKLKGPTTRETIMYEDEDFILSVDNAEFDAPVYDENEDISAFILEHQDKPENNNKKTYEDRLDEIDKLIISIQGGDSNQDEE